MPISRRLGCLFVHVPKTGGTSIETALGMFRSWREEDRDAMFGLIQSVDLEARGYLTAFLQHLTAAELRALVPESDRWFSFAFVRNPWDRMVSTYANTDPHLLMRARARGVELEGLDFAEFVRRCQAVEHVHLLDQHRFVCDSEGRRLVDFVGRFETLRADFRAICERLGVRAELPHRNASEHRPYRGYYDDATRELVGRRYRRDVETFSYEF